MIKKLPKATAQTFDDIRHQRDTAQPAKAKAKTAKAPTRKARPAAAKTAEKTRAEPPRRSARSTTADDTAQELRRVRAGMIIERFTAYSAVGSIIPIPVVDTLSVVFLIVSMVKSLAGLYETPFNRDRVRAAVAGLIGGVGQAGAGTAIATALAKWTPGANMVGAAVSSATSAVLTRTIGHAFVLHFETGGTALEFDPATLRAHFKRSRAAS